jgi:phosphopantetheine--protein transferase-like protein
MESVIKPIVAEFLRIDSSAIDRATVVDKTAVKGSIMVHRMYGALANAGIVIPDYVQIKTYGELLERSGQSSGQSDAAVTSGHENSTAVTNHRAQRVGIDMESVHNLPVCADYRQDEFYKQNFTDREISYCLLQISPPASFAGLFAAKESIVKATAGGKIRSFSALEIDHDENGKPTFDGFDLSISHVNDLAIAVAVSQSAIQAPANNDAGLPSPDLESLKQEIVILKSKLRFSGMISTLSLILSVVILIIFLALYRGIV